MNTEHLEHLAAELDKRMYRKLKYGEDKYQSECERKQRIEHNPTFWRKLINDH